MQANGVAVNDLFATFDWVESDVRAAALAVVGIAITVVVYGVVALIVKLDDIGLSMAERGNAAARSFGRGLVHVVPKLLAALSAIGTIAMLWVGGGILLHGLEKLHILEALPHFVHDTAHALSGGSPVLEWLLNAVGASIVGAIVAAPIVGEGPNYVWGYRRRARLGAKLVPKKGGVLVVAETLDGALAPISAELVGAGRRLADALGVGRPVLGGAFGAGARHLVGRATLGLLGPAFPWGTLAVNLLGGLLMGMLGGCLVRLVEGVEPWRLLLGVGALGGFTTFSAFSLEVMLMLERGDGGVALGYILASVVGAVAALALGLGISRAVA